MARAEAARQRARAARQRAEVYLERGDGGLAEVEQRLASAHELTVANAERLVARLTQPTPPHRTRLEKMEAARAGQRRALVYARVCRQRGQITLAHYYEDAAASLALLADMFADDLTPKLQSVYVDDGRVATLGSVNLDQTGVAA